MIFTTNTIHFTIAGRMGLYNILFKRTSTFIASIAVGAYVLERAIDVGAQSFYDSWNRGKQWKDIKHQYE